MSGRVSLTDIVLDEVCDACIPAVMLEEARRFMELKEKTVPLCERCYIKPRTRLSERARKANLKERQAIIEQRMADIQKLPPPMVNPYSAVKNEWDIDRIEAKLRMQQLAKQRRKYGAVGQTSYEINPKVVGPGQLSKSQLLSYLRRQPGWDERSRTIVVRGRRYTFEQIAQDGYRP